MVQMREIPDGRMSENLLRGGKGEIDWLPVRSRRDESWSSVWEFDARWRVQEVIDAHYAQNVRRSDSDDDDAGMPEANITAIFQERLRQAVPGDSEVQDLYIWREVALQDVWPRFLTAHFMAECHGIAEEGNPVKGGTIGLTRETNTQVRER